MADPLYTTSGLEKKWAPAFVEEATAAAPLVVKIDGDITFTMANKFKDRMAAISREYQSEDEVRAIVIDMSAVTQIDYSGVLAIEAVLEALKPAARKRVAQGGEVQVIHGVSKTMKKGETFVQNVRGVRVHMAHVMPRANSALRTSNLLNGRLAHGQWKVTLHATLDIAIASLEEDFAAVEQKSFTPQQHLLPVLMSPSNCVLTCGCLLRQVAVSVDGTEEAGQVLQQGFNRSGPC